MNTRRIYAFIKAEIRRTIMNLKAYPFSLIINAVTFTIFMLILMVPLKMTGIKDDVYVLAFYPMIMLLLLGPKSNIEDDIKKGRFEQIYNGAYSLLEKSIINTLISITKTIIPVTLLLIITRLFIFKFNLGILNVLILFLIAILSAFPLGIILLGITLKYRKTDAFCNIVSLAVLAQLMIPLDSLSNVWRFISLFILPFGGFVSFSNEIIFNNLSPIYNKSIFILGLVINLLLWIVISLIIYKRHYNKARSLGTLGWY